MNEAVPIEKKRRSRGAAKRNEEDLRRIAIVVREIDRFDPKDIRESTDEIGDILVEGGWL